MVHIEQVLPDFEDNQANGSKEAPPKASTREGDAADAASGGFETARNGNADVDNDEFHEEEQRGKGSPSSLQSDPTAAEPPAGPAKDDASSVQDALAKSNDAKLEGNNLFGCGQFEEALLKYELALQLVREMPSTAEMRSICHSNRGACFMKMGKYEDTVEECNKALELDPTYVKALVRRAEAHEKLENFEEAIADRKKILELDPSNDQSRKAILLLEPLAAEKREKMKQEMIAKLKDMGNSILGRFGMSINNFKAVKDPNTGSYSVQFQQ